VSAVAVADHAPVRVGGAGGPASVELPELARWFAGRPTPRLMAGTAVAAAAIRVALGRWSRADALLVGGMLAAQPLTEWVIHTRLLHRRPRKVLGVNTDPVAARDHRRHHADPTDLRLVFVPMPTMLEALAGSLVGAALAPDRRRAATALGAGFSIFLGYEWTHFLIHTPYRPRRAWYRSRWRTHRLHHYRNEHYWFGVTTHLGDQALRTYPAKAAVPVSGTAKRLLAS
jgi:hypothetical protein